MRPDVQQRLDLDYARWQNSALATNAMMNPPDQPVHHKQYRRKRRRTRPGAPPGTLSADPGASKPKIHLISFGPDVFAERDLVSPDQLSALPQDHVVRWLNVDGLGDTETIRRIGIAFGLHPLALEDILDVHQRPKVEAYEDHLFIITRMPVNGPLPNDQAGNAQAIFNPPGATTPENAGPAGRLETEQVALCLGRDFVVTFQERPGDIFEPVRRRLRGASGQLRAHGADYLAYTLIDAAIDAFFPLLEFYGERVEELESEVVERPEVSQIARIHDLKRDLLTARRAIWPQRELLNALIRDESALVSAQTRIYLRDCYDHTIQLIDMIETDREIASGLIDIHLSSISNRMNEVMKVLTVIATVFIPLTFIVGIYGMNFDSNASPWNMPELEWRYGYPVTMLAMAVIAAGLLASFWRRGWIGKGERSRSKRKADGR